MLEKFKNEVKEGKTNKYMWLISILAVLILGITFWPIGQKGTPQGNGPVAVIKSAESKNNLSYEQTLETRLNAMLKEMEGVGEVSVMVTIASNEEQVLAEDTTVNAQRSEEKDQAGGTRISDTNTATKRVIMQSGNTPYVVRQNEPIIKGVLVVAEGADNSLVKENITNAVMALLDVPVHKISVEKRK